MSQGISEKFSANRRRGRPSLLAPEPRVLYEHLWADIHSARGRQDKHYQARAHEFLHNAPGMEGLIEIRDTIGSRDVIRPEPGTPEPGSRRCPVQKSLRQLMDVMRWSALRTHAVKA
jgi:hypothetical protein